MDREGDKTPPWGTPVLKIWVFELKLLKVVYLVCHECSFLWIFWVCWGWWYCWWFFLWHALDIFSSFWIWKRSNLQLMNIEMLLEENQHIKRSLNQASHNGYHRYKKYFYWQTEVCLIIIYLRVDSQRKQVASMLGYSHLTLLKFNDVWLVNTVNVEYYLQ